MAPEPLAGRMAQLDALNKSLMITASERPPDGSRGLARKRSSDTFDSVSYTHLDVYKRQAPYAAGSAIRAKENPGLSCERPGSFFGRCRPPGSEFHAGRNAVAARLEGEDIGVVTRRLVGHIHARGRVGIPQILDKSADIEAIIGAVQFCLLYTSRCV